MRLMGIYEDFALFAFEEKSGYQWTNMKMVKMTENKKKTFWHLAWNSSEQRFAKNHDLDVLLKHFPEVHDWALKLCHFVLIPGCYWKAEDGSAPQLYS